MIDINLIRNDETFEKVIESENKRFKDSNKVIEIRNLDKERIKQRYNLDQINKEININNTKIADLKKKSKNTEINKKMSNIKIVDGDKDSTKLNNEKEIIIEDINGMNEERKMNEAKMGQEDNILLENLKNEQEKLKEEKNKIITLVTEIEQQINNLLKSIGNILHEDVIVSKSEEDNPIIFTFQSDRKVKASLSYPEICSKIIGADTIRGSRISGHRGYFLMGELAYLSLSLINYAVDFLKEKNFLLIQPPVFLNKDVMAKTVQLSDFDEQLYKLEEDLYLIATSEQPLTAFHYNERLDPSTLPLYYCGQSLCFRKEAGAHGKDNQGIFRVHQFEKIEQFVISEPSQSMKIFHEMVENSVQFYKSLDISHRVVGIVSGEMNDAASIKYDLEASFPGSDRYRELVSVSNCTDFQSRELEVRFGVGKENAKKVYVHMLNGTLCAIQRTLCCILENYQSEDGVIVPEVLRKYFKKDFIPYLK
ncbi:serine--tRNA ligase [Hamiltosporidium tvaerminnensis]|uniref:serine--tRNA ligase n=1 Tax=Hamiltosporidium tvaerminnensis TaxID=1176355 RepID=A0A4Q9LSM9_9MICR|nr:serine--tRNA ligase [Hamiltosporidium tvaerminnensis]